MKTDYLKTDYSKTDYSKTDYLIVGSGLSALVFGALMAQRGHRVNVLEAHGHPGGFGHTFTMAKKYTFNAQLHYVWDCGEGQTVNRVLKKLGLDQTITFERYDPKGFDHMRMPGYSLEIPSDPNLLMERLINLFPDHSTNIRQFIQEMQKTREGLRYLSPPIHPLHLFQNLGVVTSAISYLGLAEKAIFPI